MIIDLQKKDKVIPYKDYIRQIVEANTVYLRDSFDTRFRAVEIFRRLPVKPIQKKNVWSIMLMFILGIITGIFIFGI